MRSKRGKVGQAKHDQKVRQRLDYHKEMGRSVKADLPGRSRPPKIGGVIPDIVAKTGKELIVEEIETRSTLRTDKKQQERLKTGTKKLGGKFKVILAK